MYSEYKSGNHEIAIRHWKIAAEAGDQESLNVLRGIYNDNMPGRSSLARISWNPPTIERAMAQMEVKSEEREKHSGIKG